MTERLCPFDKTPLSLHRDRWGEPYFTCENCKQQYSRYQVDDLERVKQTRVENAEEELKYIRKREKDLTKLLSLAEDTKDKKL